MRCKDIERLIIDSSDLVLSPEESQSLEQHLKECSRCMKFQENYEAIRNALEGIPVPSLPAELEQRTRFKCWHDKEPVLPRTDRIPGFLWAALFALIVLTVIFTAVLVEDFSMEAPLSHKSALFLTLVLQNAAMLFFAPVLIRKYRSHEDNHEMLLK